MKCAQFRSHLPRENSFPCLYLFLGQKMSLKSGHLGAIAEFTLLEDSTRKENLPKCSLIRYILYPRETMFEKRAFIKKVLVVQVNVKVSWICFNGVMDIMVKTSPLSDGMNLEVKFYEQKMDYR